MADDQTPPAEGGELILTPEDQVQDEPKNDEQPDPIATLAAEMGWAPKDQFKGDPEKWRDPADFIRAGRDIQRDTASQLKSMRSTIDTIAKTSATLFEQRLAEEKAKLQDQHTAAVEDGDSATAFKLAQKIDRLDGQPQRQAPPAEAEAFVAKNEAWFNKDPLATKRAAEVCEAYAGTGASVAEQLAAADRVIRKEFPEHFPQTKQAPSVNAPTRNGTGATGKKGFAQLPAEAQKVARRFLEESGIPLETYATNFFASERKVG